MSDSVVTFDPATGQPILLSKARPPRKVKRDPSIRLPGIPTVKLTPVSEVVKRETEKANRATARQPSTPSPRSRERFHFSDPGTRTAPARSKGTPALSVEKAAEHYGLTEAELTTRVVGRAKLQMTDGKMLIRKSDLDRLASEGRLPDPAKRKQVAETVAEVEGKPSTDPATDRRTESMADAIGVELTQPAKPSKPGETKPSRVPGIATVRATDRKPYRLGAPLRWGQSA